jgi:copper chaperone CopZ
MSQTIQKFKVEGMHCTSCAMSIDMDLEDIEGIAAAKTSYPSSTTEVTYDATKVDMQKIIGAISGAGYTVAPV